MDIILVLLDEHDDFVAVLPAVRVARVLNLRLLAPSPPATTLSDTPLVVVFIDFLFLLFVVLLPGVCRHGLAQWGYLVEAFIHFVQRRDLAALEDTLNGSVVATIRDERLVV